MKKYKYKRKLVEIECDYCGNIHTKPESEYNRNKIKGRKNYCSRSCCGKVTIKQNIPKESIVWEHLKGINRRDKYTGFREHIRRIHNRHKKIELTLDDLLEQWNKQNGKCIYSGVTLTNPISTRNYYNNPICTASLDRVDSSKGYTKDNIQFISYSMNYMKNNMTHEQTIDLCKIICNFWDKKD
jgi:hypothetical protein